MTLKEINPLQRIIFLKEFTKEIVHNLAKKEYSVSNIRVAKLRKKLLGGLSEPSNFKKPFLMQKKIQKPIPQKMPPSQQPIPNQQQLNNQKPNVIITPETTLIKLMPMIKDPSVQSIECSGPGRNITIKRYNKTNLTRIALSQQEINNIINYFSQKAKIPIVGGILKAAVKNTIISAIFSEFVGSRFLINKITPYSLIE